MVATMRASSTLLSFLGPEPEPEVTRFMQYLQGGDKVLRTARKFDGS